jgi:hypothetical protein
VPPDDLFGKLLAALEGAGGKVTATAIARRLDTIELDRGLLLRQFDLLAEDRP